MREGVTQPSWIRQRVVSLAGQLLQRETNNGKASELGEAAVIYGDASRVIYRPGKLQAVTATEVQEALNRYISGKKKVVIEYLPEAMKPAAPGKGGEEILMSPRTKFRKKSCHPEPRRRRGISLAVYNFLPGEGRKCDCDRPLRPSAARDGNSGCACPLPNVCPLSLGNRWRRHAAGALCDPCDKIRHPKGNEAREWLARDRG